MEAPICLIESALGELFAEIKETGRITRADRYGLLAAVFDENLTEEELRSLSRIYRAIVRKQIEIVDEISTIEK
jgi:nucleoside-triphosphatase THEP1